MPTPNDQGQTFFSLAIPASWSEIELHPIVRDKAAAKLVSDMIAVVPDLAPRKAEIVAYYRDVARQAWDSGARFCATFTEPSDDGLIIGAITVAAIPNPPTAGLSVLDAVLDQTGQAEVTQDGTCWRQTTTVELPNVGLCARTFGVQPVALVEGQSPIPTVVMHTFVPYSEGIFLIVGTSPVIEVQGELLELFDAVTSRFRISEN